MAGYKARQSVIGPTGKSVVIISTIAFADSWTQYSLIMHWRK